MCSWMMNQPLPSSRVSRVLNLTGAPLPAQSPGTGFGSIEAITWITGHHRTLNFVQDLQKTWNWLMSHTAQTMKSSVLGGNAAP